MSSGKNHYETKSESVSRKKNNTNNSDFEAEKSSTISTSESESGSKKKSPPTWKSYLILIVILGVYIGFNFLGSYIFMVIERRNEAGSYHWFNKYKEDFVRNITNLTMSELEMFLKMVEKAMDDDVSTILGNESIFEEKWTISSGFLLSFTIASTIGYGTVTPVTAGGQVFCIFYALFSIPFTGLLAAKIGSLMAYSIKRASGIIFQNKNNHRVKIASILFTFFLGLLLYLLIPTLILLFVSNEEQWTFIECLYCVFVTLTTIGFGDYVPDPGSSGGMLINVFVLIWVVAGLAWFATIVQLIANVLTKQASSIKKKVANPHMTMKSFKSATATLAGKSRTRSTKSSQSSAEAGQSDRGEGSRGKQDHVEKETPDDNTRNPQGVRMPNGGKINTDQPIERSKVDEIVTSENNGGNENDSPDRIPNSSDKSHAERVKRNDSTASKQDEDVMLGPSGFLAIIMNNMEDYEAPEDKSGTES